MKKEGSSCFEGQVTQKLSQAQMISGSKNLEEVSDVAVYGCEMQKQQCITYPHTTVILL